MKRILIIEDDNKIAKELKELLENSGYQPNVLNDFSNALEEILNSNSDMVLLDIGIPYLNGELLLKELRKTSNVPVIMLTSRNNDADEVLSITFGADDFITKPYNPTVLLLRIANIFKRTESISDTICYRNLKINLSKGTISNDYQEILLTKNEMIIFSYLLMNKERIVKRDELMTELWNNDEYINDNALTVNISRLRNKLSDLNIEDAIETRKGVGYILL